MKGKGFMNVRIRFEKYSTMKFIGHLDVLRYFQKAVRRAELPVAYSQGFHPHQIMSFASPLGVGVTSGTEFMDLELTEFVPAKEIVKRLDAAMTDGFAVTGCRYLPEPENGRKRETAMSLITCADYLVSLKDGYAFGDAMKAFEKFTAEISETAEKNAADALETAEASEKFAGASSENTKPLEMFGAKFADFLAQKEILVTKEVKKSGSEKEMDLKQYLYAAGTSLEEFWQAHPVTKNYYEVTGADMDCYLSETKEGADCGLNETEERTDCGSSKISAGVPCSLSLPKTAACADRYANGITLVLRLSAGSMVNIKPELVIEAFCKFAGVPYEPFAWQVHRFGMYTGEKAELAGLI